MRKYIVAHGIATTMLASDSVLRDAGQMETVSAILDVESGEILVIGNFDGYVCTEQDDIFETVSGKYEDLPAYIKENGEPFNLASLFENGFPSESFADWFTQKEFGADLIEIIREMERAAGDDCLDESTITIEDGKITCRTDAGNVIEYTCHD